MNFFKIFILIIFSIFLFTPFIPSKAEEFLFDYEISNTLESDYSLTTQYNVTITNNIGNDFITKSQIIFPYDPQYIDAKNGKDILVAEKEKNDDGTFTISVNQKPFLGLGSKSTYVLTLKTNQISIQKGNIKEVTIPGLSESPSVRIKKNSLKLNKSLAQIKYFSGIPQYDDNTKRLDISDKNYSHMYFNNSDSVFLIFGEKSKYNFTMSLIPEEKVNYFPFNSEEQKLTVSNISLPPDDTLLDNDGNIVIKYGKTNQPVVIKGSIEVLADKYKGAIDENSQTLENTFWKNDSRLIEIINNAKAISNATERVKYVFESISKIVRYDPSIKVIKRKDIKEILDSPNSLSSLNINDLAITILKASGLPTKLNAGFIDPNISETFSTQGLHYWLEYYDSSYNGWKKADPTLQIISPKENYYDGVGFTHIQLFKSNSGWNIPDLAQYKFDANIENGGIDLNENIKISVKSDILQSGKDKFMEVSIQNSGNTISYVKQIQSTLNQQSDITEIKKLIFPNQIITSDIKVKNENYYEDKVTNVDFTVETNLGKFSDKGVIKLSKSQEIVYIVIALIATIIFLIFGVRIFSRKKINNPQQMLNKKKNKNIQ